MDSLILYPSLHLHSSSHQNTWRLSLWWHERRRRQMKSRRITNSVLVTTTVVVACVWICEGWSGKGFQSPPTLRLVLPRPHSTHSAAINLNIPFLSNIYGSILFHTRIKSGPLQITIAHKHGSGMVEGKKKERVLCTLFYPFWCASELFGYINDDDDTQQWMWSCDSYSYAQRKILRRWWSCCLAGRGVWGVGVEFKAPQSIIYLDIQIDR